MTGLAWFVDAVLAIAIGIGLVAVSEHWAFVRDAALVVAAVAYVVSWSTDRVIARRERDRRAGVTFR